MVGLVPNLTLRGIVDYLGFAAGAVLAFGFITPLYANIESSTRKNGGS